MCTLGGDSFSYVEMSIRLEHVLGDLTAGWHLMPIAELERRRSEWIRPKPHYQRGYGSLFLRHVTQANEGCDFDFLHAGEPTPEPKIY